MQKLLTTAEVAGFLGCSKSWLNQARWNGRGPHFVKIGHKVGYRPEDIESWLEQNRFRNTTEYSATTN